MESPRRRHRTAVRARPPDATPPVVYDVYRGTTPTFIPDPSTLIASRVSGTSYVDVLPAAACFQSFWYVVRAEDSASPPNVETNTNRLQLDLLCSPPPTLNDIGNALRVVKDPARAPSLDWLLYTPCAGVSHYHVHRTLSKLGLPGTTVNEPLSRTWVDTSASGNQYLYQIRAADVCENESAN